jgi:hypothetical protein
MTNTSLIHFVANLFELKDQTILRLPETESQKLPSRGQVAVIGTINGYEFKTVLEPDGYKGHFLKIGPDLQKAAGIAAGDGAELALQVTKDWPEPTMPEDFLAALAAAPQKVTEKWDDITPMARWEWVRWINSTGNMNTRAIRIEKTISKLNGEHRRPCCVDLSACSDPSLSKSGKLLEAAK